MARSGKKTIDVFGEVRSYCLAKDGAIEAYPWGDVVWKVGGKMFAATGEGSDRVTVKASLEDQAALVQHPNIAKADYVGRFGWVTVTIVDAEALSLTMQLIDESYD